MDVDVMLAPLYELAALHLTKKQSRLLAGPARRRAQAAGPAVGWPTNMGLVTVATLATIVPGPDNIEGKRAGFQSRPLAM